MTASTADGPGLICRLTHDSNLPAEQIAHIDAQLDRLGPLSPEQIAATNALLRPHVGRNRKPKPA